jgi:hypothetical protein
MTIPSDDLAVGGSIWIGVTDIRIRRIEVGDIDAKTLSQEMDVGAGVSLTAASSAIAEDDDPRRHWREISHSETGRGGLRWTGFGRECEMGACGTASVNTSRLV